MRRRTYEQSSHVLIAAPQAAPYGWSGIWTKPSEPLSAFVSVFSGVELELGE
jgi:hypothetical protein